MISNATPYGKKVQVALIENGVKQKELIDAVQSMTGLFFDGSYLHKVLIGKCNSPKIIEAIDQYLGIEGEHHEGAS